MAEDAKRTGPGGTDPTEHSSSTAPDARSHAEETESISDSRLKPGGTHGTRVDPGMSGLDRETVPSGAAAHGLTDYGVVDLTPRADRS